MADSWSGLRKRLEKEYLCEKLRGRVQYFCTHYHGAPDDYGRFAIRVDGVEHLFGNPYCYYIKGYAAMENRLKREGGVPCRDWVDGVMLYEDENYEVEKTVKAAAVNDGVFEIYDITDGLRIYTQSPIDESLKHPDPTVRLFAVLDRRVGKRSLARLAAEVENQPEWLKFFYMLRLEAENIPFDSAKITR